MMSESTKERFNMYKKEIIPAWKNEEHRLSSSEAEREEQPAKKALLKVMKSKPAAYGLAMSLVVSLILAGSGARDEALGAELFIISANSAKCLTDTYAGQNTCFFGFAGQKWVIGPFTQDLGDGTFANQIMSIESGGCLDVPSSSMADGTKLQTYPCHSGDNQFFKLEKVVPGGKLVRIRALHSGKCLDVPGGSQSFVRIQQFTCHGGLNQQWLMVPANF